MGRWRLYRRRWTLDTPEAADAQQQTCDYSTNSCTDAANDLPDQIENYMDYTDENCMNMFTQQQTAAMHYVLENFRPGILLGTQRIKDNAFDFKIFPNPATGLLRVTNNLGALMNKVEIYSLDGRRHENILNENNSIDVSALRPGVYFISVRNNEQIYVRRFLKS